MLTSYYVTRFICSNCGTFETGTVARPDLAPTCPWCDEELQTAAQCKGMTSRALPYTTDPRTGAEIPDTSLDVINNQVSEKRRRNIANGKSTGRPKGGNGRSTYRYENDEHDKDADRERYQSRKRKANEAGRATTGSESEGGPRPDA